MTSELTLVECDRTLARAVAAGHVSEAEAAPLRRLLQGIDERWHLVRLEREVIERARRLLPGEPIRTLDAMHLASALVAREGVPELVLLSLDRRVRVGARALGLALAP